jgi:L-ascorbate metabolism protein UlaG (beta-lactamase superfamily)
MKIEYLGHASFLITSEGGLRLITDPYKPGCFDGGIDYEPITEEADIFTISNEHDDHNCTDIKGGPTFIRGVGKKQTKGVEITGIESFHDESGGSERGKNTIYKLQIDGMNIVHLGDLGHPLSDEDVRKIGAVDILFVPIGGYFTIDAKTAESVVDKLNPKVVIPMHFKTNKCGFPIASADAYTRNKHVKEIEGEFHITKDQLPDNTTTYLLTATK